jgi:DNA-binding NarL/FixJ family response regulator
VRFFNDEWELFLQNCGFTDDELKIIPFLRRGWAQIDISEELSISRSTFCRRKKSIMEKIARYISRCIR